LTVAKAKKLVLELWVIKNHKNLKVVARSLLLTIAFKINFGLGVQYINLFIDYQSIISFDIDLHDSSISILVKLNNWQP